MDEVSSSNNPKTIIDLKLSATCIQFKVPYIEIEKQTAIMDLLEDHYFKCIPIEGPYILSIDIKDQFIHFHVRGKKNEIKMNLPILSFSKLFKEYFAICEAYFSAVQSLTPEQIEAIDMGRRSLHNEGATILMRLVTPNVQMDLETSRRLFTIICVLILSNNWLFN